MPDDSATGEWPGVSRDGEPELIRGPQSGSVKLKNQYELRTAPVPAGADGYNWVQFFNSQFTGPRSRFTGPRPISGYHDGNKIIVECWPDDASELIETVDAAIEYANERLKALHR
jgi:hypothetical protein